MKIVIPYASEPRADTGLTNTQMGIWLFLASEVMLFGGLFSAYAFIRTAAPQWPRGLETLPVSIAVINTIVLIVGAACARAARRSPAVLHVSTAAALVFLALKTVEWRGEIAGGHLPSSSNFFALYFTLTGIHAAHVLGALIANLWVSHGVYRVSAAVTNGRIRALNLYWIFVDMVWLIIITLMYLS